MLEDDRLTRRVTIRLTPADVELIEETAKAFRMETGRFVRRAVLRFIKDRRHEIRTLRLIQAENLL